MRHAKDDLVVVERSVFPDKVGKVGVVRSADPGWDNPYEVEVLGDSTSRFKLGDLRAVTPLDVARMFNRLADEVAEMRRHAEPASRRP